MESEKLTCLGCKSAGPHSYDWCDGSAGFEPSIEIDPQRGEKDNGDE